MVAVFSTKHFSVKSLYTITTHLVLRSQKEEKKVVLNDTTLLSQISVIAIVLLIGLITAIIAKRIGIPDILLLILGGIGLGSFVRFERLGISLPHEFIAGLGIFALILIVFESTAQIRFRELNSISAEALKVTFISFLVIAFGLSVVAWGILFGFQLKQLLVAVIFGIVMADTSPDVVLSLMGKTRDRIMNILKIESILNTPLVVLLPLLIVGISSEFAGGLISDFLTRLLLNIISGLGTGIFVGLIVFKAMRSKYSEMYSPLAVIVAAVVSYALAEQLGGNGIIAVTTLGVFFGNLDIKRKISLLQFESVLTTLLRVLIFVLVGLVIPLPISFSFFIQTLLLVLAYLVLRYSAIHFAEKKLSSKQKLFMTCAAAKGLPVIIVTFILATVIGGFEVILPYILLFVLYMLVIASVTMMLSKKKKGINSTTLVPS